MSVRTAAAAAVLAALLLVLLPTPASAIWCDDDNCYTLLGREAIENQHSTDATLCSDHLCALIHPSPHVCRAATLQVSRAPITDRVLFINGPPARRQRHRDAERDKEGVLQEQHQMAP
jgi:hypothetical protein